MNTGYDLIVIGSGPGGYVCAIRAAQLGMRAAIVEKRATHGGTCLNVGCIPSKALLYASEMFEEAARDFSRLGIGVGTPKLDLEAMMEHRRKSIDANVQGIALLLKKNKIDQFHGIGRLVDGGVLVTAGAGEETLLKAENVVIATGSESAGLPGVDIDEKRIVSSTGALELDKVPDRLVVIGAGVIGLELGSVWRRLGAQVTVVEFHDHLLSGMDGETSRLFQRILTKQGMTFKFRSRVSSVNYDGQTVNVAIMPSSGEDGSEILQADVVLVAIGRRPYTQGLGLDEMGVACDERGCIRTDGRFLTSVPGVYAIGDVIAGPMLAHKAEDEGIALAEMLAGQAGHVNYETIPHVVYTMPEVASVGKSEEELKKAGIAYKVGKFPMIANGRARTMHKMDGQIKILADAGTDRVLGAHMIGAGVGEMIHELVVLMEFGGSSEDLARTCHAHPTLSEAVREASLGVTGSAIHL